MINNKFKALYNPFNRKLSVLYGDCVTNYTFGELEEWVKVSFNGDEDHPNYLHIQLDYDEELQLLFYPREDGSESLNEDMGTYFHSEDMKVPKNLTIVYNDRDFNREYERLEKGMNVTYIE